MLRALASLMRTGGRMAFTTIHAAPDLPPADRRHAYRVGPRAVASRAPQAELLQRAGFGDVDEVDVTDAFIETQRAWLDARTRHRDELAALEAPGVFDQREVEHRAQLAATEAGLLRRSLLFAIRR